MGLLRVTEPKMPTKGDVLEGNKYRNYYYANLGYALKGCVQKNGEETCQRMCGI